MLILIYCQCIAWSTLVWPVADYTLEWGYDSLLLSRGTANTYSLKGLLVVCGCGLLDTKSYLLSYNEHMIQEKDLNLLYWQPNPLCDVFQITHNVLIWGLYIDIVKCFDEYMQQLKYIFVKNYRPVFGTKTLNIIAYLEPIL